MPFALYFSYLRDEFRTQCVVVRIRYVFAYQKGNSFRLVLEIVFRLDDIQDAVVVFADDDECLRHGTPFDSELVGLSLTYLCAFRSAVRKGSFLVRYL